MGSRWCSPGLAGNVIFAVLGCLALWGCPPPEPPPQPAAEPDLSTLSDEEPVRCAAGQDETDSGCTPEGCLSPPDPEPGVGGSGAQEEIDCAAWDD